MRFFFSFCLDLKCAKLRAKKNYLMEGVSQVMTSEEEVEKSGLVTEYRTFLCVLTLPAITIDCWLLWQFYTQGFSSWCLIWIRLLLAGLCHWCPQRKEGVCFMKCRQTVHSCAGQWIWKHRCTEMVLRLFFSLLLLIWPSEFSNRFKRKGWRVSRETFGHNRQTEFLWPTLPFN